MCSSAEMVASTTNLLAKLPRNQAWDKTTCIWLNSTEKISKICLKTTNTTTIIVDNERDCLITQGRHSRFLAEKAAKVMATWPVCHQCHQCTLVGLSTRPSPLIISKYLQFRNFWSQSKALFMVRCILSVGSGSNTFGALKVTIYVKFFELSVYKMSNFLRISAC